MRSLKSYPSSENVDVLRTATPRLSHAKRTSVSDRISIATPASTGRRAPALRMTWLRSRAVRAADQPDRIAVPVVISRELPIAQRCALARQLRAVERARDRNRLRGSGRDAGVLGGRCAAGRGRSESRHRRRYRWRAGVSVCGAGAGFGRVDGCVIVQTETPGTRARTRAGGCDPRRSSGHRVVAEAAPGMAAPDPHRRRAKSRGSPRSA